MLNLYQRWHYRSQRWRAFTRDMLLYAAIYLGVVGFVALVLFVGDKDNEMNPGLKVIITGAAALFCGYYFVMEYQRRGSLKAYRGRTIHQEYGARTEARRKRTKEDRGVLWGKVRIPSSDAMTHFCIVGGIGSGKTLTMRILMQDQLPLIEEGSDRRALIFDSKEDFVQVVAGIDPSCPLYIFNPFDSRRVAWDLAKDIDYAPIVRNFAAAMFPSLPDSKNKFYEETPQVIVSALLQVFIARAPGAWTMRHLVLAMQDSDLTRALTDGDPQAKATIARAFAGNPKSLGDVMSTINTKLAPFADFAASWEGATKSISIREWLTTSSIIILPKFGPAESETERLYNLFVNTLASNLSMLEESYTRRSWVFLDEFTQLGEIKGLKRLILEGRDKGFSCVLATQQPGLVHAAYGKEQGEALLSECANKALLKMANDAASQWASAAVSNYDDSVIEPLLSDSTQQGQPGPEPHFPAHYFGAIPKAGFENGLSGVYLNPSIVGWSAHYSPAELRSLLPHPDKNVDRFEQLDSDALVLKRWSSEDSALFGIEWPLGGRPDSDDPLAGI